MLSLQLSSDEVIPIPCILDTGAPGIMNLGTGAMKALFRLGLVDEDSFYRLRGALYWRNTSIQRPIVDNLLYQIEAGHLAGTELIGIGRNG